MTLLLACVGILLLSGAAAAALPRRGRDSGLLAVAGAIGAGALGLAAALPVLLRGGSQALRFAWSMPYGSIAVGLDPLSAFFLIPILGIAILGAIFGRGYLAAARPPHPSGPSWLFYHLMVAGMVGVVIARNGVLFLMAWEVMSLAAFFLVTQEGDERPLGAGWTYLVATHVGTAALVLMFLLLGRASGSLDFDALRVEGPAATVVFLLALAGFGTKAGLMPFHVWLPEAHPAAPSHVSGFLSGAMVTTGIYGLLRLLPRLGLPPGWWGLVLIGVGLLSATLGVLASLAQVELKRLLAYSTVENLGIVAMGVGLGILALAAGEEAPAVLAFAGALLHLLHHAVFKPLLFFGAGVILRGTGTLEIGRLGGLLRRMPRAGTACLIGAAAIAGLPPLCGFAGEFVVYLAAYRSAAFAGVAAAAPALVVIAGLALTGGLAAAAFVRAFGVVLLGEPRETAQPRACEPGRQMLLPMQVLAALCLALGLGAPWVVVRLAAPVQQITGLPAPAVGAALDELSRALLGVSAVGGAGLALAGLLAAGRWALLRRRRVTEAETWACGYARPTPRMQYNAASLSEPLVHPVRHVLGVRRRELPPAGVFPDAAFVRTGIPPLLLTRLLEPSFASLRRGTSLLRGLQHGRVQLYVLYIVLTLVTLLLWHAGRSG